jgi:hypothetical protein
VLRGNVQEAAVLYDALELRGGQTADAPDLLFNAARTAEIKKCGYYR